MSEGFKVGDVVRLKSGTTCARNRNQARLSP